MSENFEARARALQTVLAERGGAESEARWERAWEVAREAHAGQLRNHGGPMLDHALAVAEILAFEWQAEPLVVMGGLLHDTIRYGQIAESHTLARLLRDREMSNLVAVATRLAETDPLVHHARTHEHLETIFEVMVEDVRAVLIRIANRLHNLRDAAAYSSEQMRLIVLNSREVYLPLLERLGMTAVRNEIDNLCLQLRDADTFEHIVSWQAQQQQRRAGVSKRLLDALHAALHAYGIPETQVERRQSSPSFILKRHLMSPARTLEQLDELDSRYLETIWLITPSVATAYTALAAAHSVGAPSAANFHDHLAQPKLSGYAALNTTVIRHAEGSEAIRIAITTQRLAKLSRWGILAPAAFAHWCGEPLPADWETAERAALARLVESLRRVTPAADFITVLTPRGDVVDTLTAEATVLDFAYHIHSDLGRQVGSALVNGRPVPLFETLHNGDVVEIRKDPARQWPDDGWLEWVKTPKARSKLQQQLNQRPDRKGHRLLEKELRSRGRSLDDYASRVVALAQELGLELEELYSALARGDYNGQEIADRLIFHSPSLHTRARIELPPEWRERLPSWSPENLLVESCCAPVTGEAIVGRLGRRGVELHAADCPTLAATPEGQTLIPLIWSAEPVEALRSRFSVRAVNRVGLLHDLTEVISAANVDIVQVEGRRSVALAQFTFDLEIRNELELGHLINTIRAVCGINRVEVDGQEASVVVDRLAAFLAPPQPLHNPFSPGRPVAGGGSFWGRSVELEWLETRLLGPQRPASLLVRGQRRIGKTSLLYELGQSRAIRAHFRPVYADLQSVAHSPADEVVRYLIRRIGRELDPTTRVPRPGQSEVAADPRTAFMAYLEALGETLRHAQKRVLVTIDEFGVLIDAMQAGALDRQFFHLLRSVIQHDPTFVFIFATSDDMADLLRAEGVCEVLNVTQELRVSHLAREDARHLIQEPLRGEVYFDPEAQDELVRVTDAHPYYLQILGAALISQLNHERRRHVLVSDIHAVVERQAQGNGSEFLHYWRRDAAADRMILSALAEASPKRTTGMTAEELSRTLAARGLTLPAPTVASALDRLFHAEALTRQPKGESLCYRFRVELFRRWFAEHHPLAQVAHELALPAV